MKLLKFFEVELSFRTLICGVEASHSDLPYYKDIIKSDKTRVDCVFEEAKIKGWDVRVGEMGVGEVQDRIGSGGGCLAIVLINAAILNFTSSNSQEEAPPPDLPYHGHYVVVCGFVTSDTTSPLAVIYDPAKKASQNPREIPLSLFDQARLSSGTDQDIIFIPKSQSKITHSSYPPIPNNNDEKKSQVNEEEEKKEDEESTLDELINWFKTSFKFG